MMPWSNTTFVSEKSMSKPECPKNNMHEVHMNYKYDTYYCTVCDKWLEGKCADFNCWVCKERPTVPSECKDDEC